MAVELVTDVTDESSKLLLFTWQRLKMEDDRLASRSYVPLLLKIGISSASGLLLLQCLRKLFPRQSKQLQRWFFTQLAMKCSANQIGQSLAPYKETLFAQMARDNVKILEIGIGHGSNLSYYPTGCSLYSIEPNPYFETYFKENMQKFTGIKVEAFVRGSAEDMSMIADSSMHVVVSTHVLCSVTDVTQSLQEIMRVLVPGGKFYYIEHIGFDSRSPVRRLLQTMSEPVWQLFSDGCKLTRNPCEVMNTLHSPSGFALKIQREVFVLVDGVYSVMKPHVVGIRRKELLISNK